MREMAFSLSAKTDVALAYALERWDALSLYVADGRLAIDNRPAERALRAVALTRKTFLFLCCDEGGRRAAIIYTLAQTVKMNGLNPYAYLAGVLDAMARGRSNPGITDLTPWAWAATHRQDDRSEYGVRFAA